MTPAPALCSCMRAECHFTCELFVASQVMIIGIVCVLEITMPALLQVLCKGGMSRIGLWRKAIVAMAEHARYERRLPDASTTAPGYVVFLRVQLVGSPLSTDCECAAPTGLPRGMFEWVPRRFVCPWRVGEDHNHEHKATWLHSESCFSALCSIYFSNTLCAATLSPRAIRRPPLRRNRGVTV